MRPSSILSILLVAILPAVSSFALTGCGSADAESPAAKGKRNHELNQKVQKRFKALDKKIKALAKSPEPVLRARSTDLQSKLNFLRVNFEAKVKARLGDVPQALYHSTMKQVEELEKKL